MFKRSLKIIAIFVLVVFIYTNVLPTQQMSLAASIENIKNTKANINYEKPTVSTQLGNFAKDISEYTAKLRESLEGNNFEEFKKDLKISREALKDIRLAVEKELSVNQMKLEDLDVSEAKKRHNSFAFNIQNQLNVFEGLFEKTDKILSTANTSNIGSIEELKSCLEEIENQLGSEQPEQTLGKSLPHNNVSVVPPEPAIGSGANGIFVDPKATGDTSSLPKVPTEEDLAQTPETKWTQEIKALADSLKTPVKMQEYVRNNVDFEPYYGSRRGAFGTLNQMSGNDYDQASLLISMLRYKGIPARYVKGTVEIPIDKVIGWTGAQNPKEAVKVLGSLGIPTVSLVSAGEITAVRTEHIWVEAYLDYDEYRGIGETKADKIWVPLDPSFKQYSFEEGLDIKEITGVSDEQIIEAFKVNGDRSVEDGTITNISTDEMKSFLDTATDKLQNYLKDNKLENADVKQLIGGKRIVPEVLEVLPLTLPYKTITELSKTNIIPKSSSEKIGFSIRGNDPYNLNFGSSDDFNVEYRAVELYGKRITLSWIPASKEDSDIINSYGGLFNTPAYLIQLKPQLKVDGEVVAEGKAVGFGNRQEFTISMGHVGTNVEMISNPVIAGGIYSISFDFGKIDVEELEQIKQRVLAIKDTATETNIYTDEILGEILNSVGKTYFAQLDAINSLIAKASNVVSIRQVSEAMTGYSPKVKYMFNVPVEVKGGSFFIDVDHDVFAVTSLEGKKENEIAYMMNTGVLGSSMEHVIHEQIFQIPAVSSIKILTEASERGIPIYSISKDNIDKLSEINVSSSVKNDIRNAVNSGKVVTIPKQEITYYDWEGTGYIVMDPETGAAGYMISGGLAGGSVAIDVGVTLIGLIALVWAIYDVITIAMALLAATNPFIMIFFFALYVLSIINVIMTLQNILMYWETGDYQYASALFTDLLLNIAFAGIFKVLDLIAPGIMSLFKGVKNQLDEVAEIAAKYGDEVAEMAARYGDDAIEAITKYGDDAIEALTLYGDDALKIIKNYGDDALEVINKYGDDAIKAIKNHGDDALKAIKDYGLDAVELINKYGDDALKAIKNHGGDAIRAIKNYGDDALKAINKYGTDAVEVISKYGDDAVKAIKDYGLDAVELINKYGDDAVNAIKNHGGDAIRAVKKYGDEAMEVIAKYGDDAVNAIAKYGEDGLTAIYVYGDELVESIAKFGDDAVESAIKYGDDAISTMNRGISPSKLDEILSAPKGTRPDPSTYLSKDYINQHLSMFDDGVTRIQWSAPDRPVGPPQGTFAMPKATADEMISKANGDVRKLEELLGLNKGDLGDAPVRVDIPEPTGVRMPTGNEPGANEFWIPGGYTSGGIPEVVIDQVPLDKIIVNPIFN